MLLCCSLVHAVLDVVHAVHAVHPFPLSVQSAPFNPHSTSILPLSYSPSPFSHPQHSPSPALPNPRKALSPHKEAAKSTCKSNKSTFTQHGAVQYLLVVNIDPSSEASKAGQMPSVWCVNSGEIPSPYE